MIFIEDIINEVNNSRIIIEANIVDKKCGIRFFSIGARFVFAKLRQAFSITPILHHFEVEYYIRIKTNASSYTISGIFAQLALDGLS